MSPPPNGNPSATLHQFEIMSTGSPSQQPPGAVPLAQVRSRAPSTRSRTTSSSLSAPPSPSARTRAHLFSPHSSSPTPPPTAPPYQQHQQRQRPPSSPLPTTTTIHPSKLPSPPLNSPLQFDMKRLLAKPAPPYAQRGHGQGHASGSESEGTHTHASRAEAGKGNAKTEGEEEERYRKASLPTSFEIDIDIDTGTPLDLALDSFGVTSSPQSRLGESTVLGTPSPPRPAHAQDPEKRPRNVLRRRPSTTTTATATASTTPAPKIPRMPSSSSLQSRDIPRSAQTTGKSPTAKSPLPPPPPPPPSSSSRSPTTPGTSWQNMSSTPAIMTTTVHIPSHDPHAHAPGMTICNDGKTTSAARTPIYTALATASKISGGGDVLGLGLGNRGALPTPTPPRLRPLPQPQPQHKERDGDMRRDGEMRRGSDARRDGDVRRGSDARRDGDTRRESDARRDKDRDKLALAPDSHRRRGDSRSRSRSRSRNPAERSPPLTPAGAVVEAYKRQEEAREGLASASAGGSSASVDSMNPNLNSNRKGSMNPNSASVGSVQNPNLNPSGRRRPLPDHRAGTASASASDSTTGFVRPIITDDEEERGRGAGAGETGFDVIARVVGRGSGGVVVGSGGLVVSSGSGSSGPVVGRGSGSGREGEGARKADEDEDGASAPYYTVIGSTSGRVVAVGGAEDRSLDRVYWEPLNLDLGGGSGGGRSAAGKVSTGAGVGKVSTGTGAGAAGKVSTGAGPGTGVGAGIARTLSKKVSGRWRRGGGEATVSGGEEERERKVEGGRPRPSLQERRVGRFSNVGAGEQEEKARVRNRRSLHLSIDKFGSEDADVDVIALNQKALVQPLPRSLPLTPLTGTVVAESHADDAWLAPRLKVRKSLPAGGAGAGGGSRIWKLVKRISTGGLREKYSHYDFDEPPPPPPPPVPALPKDYQTQAIPRPRGPRSADGRTVLHRGEPLSPPQTGGLARFMPSRPSSAGTGAGVITKRKSSLALGSGSKMVSSPQGMGQSPTPPSSASTPTRQTSRPSPSHPTNTNTNTNANSPNPRPSTTTRSSSPNSSDVASARFFQRQSSASASARSSTSSLFGDDDPPPMPKPLPKPLQSASAPAAFVSVGRHIIPPSELYRMHSDHEKAEAKAKARDGEGAAAKNPNQNQSQSQNRDQHLRLVVPSAAWTSDEWMIVQTPAVELQSLPIPPRRVPVPKYHSTPSAPKHHSEPPTHRSHSEPAKPPDANERPPSPAIPAFSTSDAINTFGPSSRRTSTDTRRAKHPPLASVALPGPLAPPPPPRPSRSLHRPSPNKSTPSSPVRPMTAPQAGPSARRVASENTPAPHGQASTEDYERRLGGPNPNWRSSGGASTATTRPHPRPALGRRSSSLSSSPPTPRRTMTFRELGKGKGKAEEKQALTEQEKADRWDDLLERSARAGGTLHLGGGGGEDGLRSDRLRFSGVEDVG